MVSILEVEALFPYLLKSSMEMPALNELDSSLFEISDQKLLGKDKSVLKVNEERRLLWLRHGQSFKLKKFSPDFLLSSWTLEVDKLIQKVWNETITKDDGLALLYMGKLGAGELNLSSDIDLIAVGDVRGLGSLRNFIKGLSCPSLFPVGFKVDFDLRPGGKSAPMLSSADNFGNHIWNQSDPWERYSYTRAKVALGEEVLKNKVSGIIDKFCYRKYLNSDFFSYFLKLRKTYQSSLQDPNNIKLGAGGIRDVELFAQTFQILYGSKDEKFKGLSTFSIIDRLIEKDIHSNIFKELKLCYLVLRQAEGLIHSQKEGAGFKWKEALDPILSPYVDAARKKVVEIINGYVASETFIAPSFKKVTRKTFKEMVAKETELRGIESAQALENFDLFFSEKNKRFKPYIQALCAQGQAQASFIDLLCYSKFGCEVLSRRPALLDLFLLRKYEISEDLQKSLEQLSDIKMLKQILASIDFIKKRESDTLGVNLSRAYENIIDNLMKDSCGLDLLFLGKMATREIGLKSDLDFIIIFDEVKLDRAEATKKARLLYQRFSHTSLFGALIPFDKSGGPMGSASPLVLSKKSLEEFLIKNAQPWQKLMYLKHRFLKEEAELKFIDQPMSDLDLNSIFEIIRKRIHARDFNSDKLKLGEGGLLHIEFLEGLLWLKKGLQPNKAANPSLLRWRELSSYYMDYKSVFIEIAELYEKIKLKREESFIVQNLALDVKGLLFTSAKLLKKIESEIFKQQVSESE